MLRRIFLLCVLSVFVLVSISCGFPSDEPRVIQSIEVNYEDIESPFILGEFRLDALKLLVRYTDGSIEYVTVTQAMVSQDDMLKLELVGTHEIELTYQGLTTTITITFMHDELTTMLLSVYSMGVSEGLIEGTYEDWLDSIKGEDGTSIVSIHISAEGRLIITLSDATVIDVGLIVGADGQDGEDGVSVVDTFINPEGYLIIELSNGQFIDAGKVTATDGQDGLTAYEIYLIYYPDYIGTEEDWLEDLVGGNLGQQFTHTITFVSNGGTYFDPLEGVNHQTTTLLPVPERDSYEFLGWYLGETINDGQVYNNTKVTESLTLYARWRLVDYGLLYEIIDGEVIIFGFTGPEKTRFIPSTIEGYPVTRLGEGQQLFGATYIRSVTLSPNVQVVGNYAFHNAYSLEEIIIPEDSQLENIGVRAFNNSNISNIYIPKTVLSIGDWAFAYARLLTEITLEEDSQLEYIGESAFAGTAITEFYIPISVLEIGQSAFNANDYLTIIYAEIDSQPGGWNDNWNNDNIFVVWGVIGKYTVSFETFGGTETPQIYIYNNTPIHAFVDKPMKNLHVFKGWYEDPEFTLPIDTVPAYNVTAYAKWKAIEFNMVQVGEVDTTYTVPVGYLDFATSPVTGGYLMATTQTTYELWYEVRVWAEAHGYHFQNPGREGDGGTIGAAPTVRQQQPVTTVSWHDTIVWLNALSETSGFNPVYRDAANNVIRDSREANAAVLDAAIQTSNNGYRLPTSNETEMAARWKDDTESTDGSILIGGRYWTPYNYASGATADYNDEIATRAVAWYWNAHSVYNATRPVGQRVPNHLGIYDMSGNVSEWHYDWHPSYVGYSRIIRGGGWLDEASDMSVYVVYDRFPQSTNYGTGFRFVRNESIIETVELVQVGETDTTYTIPTGTLDSGRTTVAGGYLMATTQTTYQLWYEVRVWAEAHGYHFQNRGREGQNGVTGAAPTVRQQEPVTNISWRDTIVWLNALSEMSGFNPVYRTSGGDIIKDSRDANGAVVDAAVQTSENGYRLPTSFEWEMAARWKNDTTSTHGSILVDGRYWTPGDYASGATADYNDGTATQLVAWYSLNSGNKTQPVGQLLPNHLGIYDMSGNVFDWTYTANGSNRIVRGSGWFLPASIAQVGYVSGSDPTIITGYHGFRYVRNP